MRVIFSNFFFFYISRFYQDDDDDEERKMTRFWHIYLWMQTTAMKLGINLKQIKKNSSDNNNNINKWLTYFNWFLFHWRIMNTTIWIDCQHKRGREDNVFVYLILLLFTLTLASTLTHPPSLSRSVFLSVSFSPTHTHTVLISWCVKYR